MSETDLDSLTDIKSLDKENVYGSVQAFPDQCTHAWQEASKVKVPEDYRKIDKLVMTGMGGSGLAARMIESLYWKQLKVPITQVHEYDLPGFVDAHTLVICSSYSGTTEEVIENFYQARAKKAKIMATATGSKLEQLATKAQIPFYKIEPKYNPSNQPRMAVGYSVMGQIAMLKKVGLIDLTTVEITQAVKVMKNIQPQLKIETPELQNPAKQLARQMYNKIIVFVAAEHLTGALHTVKNQSNENSKNFSARFDLPELNHHLMESLKFPSENAQNLMFLLVNSDLYRPQNKKRLEVMKDIIEKHKIASFEYKPLSQTPLSQAFEAIQFGAYAVFYLSMLNDINPAPIPWVDYFKRQLNRHSE